MRLHEAILRIALAIQPQHIFYFQLIRRRRYRIHPKSGHSRIARVMAEYCVTQACVEQAS